MAYPGVDEGADFPKKGYAVKDTTIVTLRQPGTISDDPLTGILRAEVWVGFCGVDIS